MSGPFNALCETKIGPRLYGVGTRVHCCKGTQIGTITEIEQGGSALVPKWVYGVKFDNGNSTAVYADSLAPVDES